MNQKKVSMINHLNSSKIKSNIEGYSLININITYLISYWNIPTLFLDLEK